MSTYAHVTNGVVDNIIVAEPGFSKPDFYDVTGLSPRPGIGWTYSGGVFSPPATSVAVLTKAARATILRRMTPTELHAWRRAVVRAEATNTPTVGDRQLCYAWHLWDQQPDLAEVTGADMTQLGQWWVTYAVVTNAARAAAILEPEA